MRFHLLKLVTVVTILTVSPPSACSNVQEPVVTPRPENPTPPNTATQPSDDDNATRNNSKSPGGADSDTDETTSAESDLPLIPPAANHGQPDGSIRHPETVESHVVMTSANAGRPQDGAEAPVDFNPQSNPTPGFPGESHRVTTAPVDSIPPHSNPPPRTTRNVKIKTVDAEYLPPYAPGVDYYAGMFPFGGLYGPYANPYYSTAQQSSSYGLKAPYREVHTFYSKYPGFVPLEKYSGVKIPPQYASAGPPVPAPAYPSLPKQPYAAPYASPPPPPMYATPYVPKYVPPPAPSYQPKPVYGSPKASPAPPYVPPAYSPAPYYSKTKRSADPSSLSYSQTQTSNDAIPYTVPYSHPQSSYDISNIIQDQDQIFKFPPSLQQKQTQYQLPPQLYPKLQKDASISSSRVQDKQVSNFKQLAQLVIQRLHRIGRYPFPTRVFIQSLLPNSNPFPSQVASMSYNTSPTLPSPQSTPQKSGDSVGYKPEDVELQESYPQIDFRANH